MHFHLLRRQAALLKGDPLPLVVLTPKSLLRHPFVASAPADFSRGSWMPALDDAEAKTRAATITRLIWCSGKVAVDVLTHPRRAEAASVAVCRMEQWFPMPVREMTEMLGRYPNVSEVVWLQEEPENMGAWDFARPAPRVDDGLAAPDGAGAAAQLQPRRGIGCRAREESRASHRASAWDRELGFTMEEMEIHGAQVLPRESPWPSMVTRRHLRAGTLCP